MPPFAIRYRAAAPLTLGDAARVHVALARFVGGSAWMLCEQPCLTQRPDGHLAGSSALNMTPRPEEVRAAMAVCGPDGTAETLFEVLDQVSRECGVDWELSHSLAEGVAGHIAGGVTDAGARRLLDQIAELAESLMPAGAGEPPATD